LLLILIVKLILLIIRTIASKGATTPNIEIVGMFSNGPIVRSRLRECTRFITVVHHVLRATWLRGDAAHTVPQNVAAELQNPLGNSKSQLQAIPVIGRGGL
jgi:hypothetical protein